MQSVQDVLKKSKSLPNSSESLTKSTQGEKTSVDYWSWYFQPGNSVRAWDEAHGIQLVKSELSGCPCFVADPDVLFSDSQPVNSFPEYFQNRTLDKFSVGLYSYNNQGKAQKAYDMVKRYIENYSMIVAQYSGGGLYFYSKERGTGKTFLSTILGNELSRKGHRVRWYNMTSLLQEIKAGYDRESSTSSSDIIDICRNSEVLILDDIGVEKQSAWVNETVYSILDYRMTQCRPTIFTSNHAPGALSYDERIIDRIQRMTELVIMPEESIRKKLNQGSQLSKFLNT